MDNGGAFELSDILNYFLHRIFGNTIYYRVRWLIEDKITGKHNASPFIFRYDLLGSLLINLLNR